MRWLRAYLSTELGVPGFVALGLLAAAALFYTFGARPLEERRRNLDRELDRLHRRSESLNAGQHRIAVPGAKLVAFYRYFERDDNAVLWLAKLYGISRGAGVELSTGEYRLADARRSPQRYQLTFPVAGTYPRIREFIEKSLGTIPVLSLDQINFHRRRANETRIEAVVVFTLYLAKS